MRNNHAQKLRDDRCCDVGHDAQSKNRQLEQCSTAEEVDQLVETSSAAGTGKTLLNIAVINKRGGDEGAHTEKRHHKEGERNFLPQVGSPEDSP